MKIFTYHENASGKGSFTKTGDAYFVNEDRVAFAVADSPLRCLILDTKEYPFDDFGFDAADTFCKNFVKFCSKYTDGAITKDILKEILLKTNREILKLNNSLGKSYDDELNYDVAETVGVGAVVEDNILLYGGVEDCYVNVLRGEELENIAPWNHQIMKASKYIDELSEENKLIDYVPEELRGKLREEHYWEPCWCSYLRNNSNAFNKEDDLVGWGCFTGEKELEPFIQTHEVELREGDHILIFSDGMIPVLKDKGFLRWFIKNQNNSFYFQLEMREKIIELLKGKSDVDKEKTLVYFRY